MPLIRCDITTNYTNRLTDKPSLAWRSIPGNLSDAIETALRSFTSEHDDIESIEIETKRGE